MHAHSRFERRSLRDVLVSQGVLTPDVADDLIESSRTGSEPFGVSVIQAGYMTDWDLARLVATQFQMPILPLKGYRFEGHLAEDISAATLYHHWVLPVGRFGASRSFAVVEPPSRECIESLRETCGSSLFFFVSEAQDLRDILKKNVKVVDPVADTQWENIFDAADQVVQGDREGGDAEEPAAEDDVRETEATE